MILFLPSRMIIQTNEHISVDFSTLLAPNTYPVPPAPVSGMRLLQATALILCYSDQIISVRLNVKSSRTRLCPCDAAVAPPEGQSSLCNFQEVTWALSVSLFSSKTGHGSCSLIEAPDGANTSISLGLTLLGHGAPRDEKI